MASSSPSKAGSRTLPPWLIPAAIAVVIFAALAIQALSLKNSEFESVYVDAAAKLLRGEDFYGAHALYRYPPFGAVLAIPFIPLPSVAIRLVWLAISMVAAYFLFLLSWQVAGGRIEPQPTGWKPWVAALAAVIIAGTYMLNTLAHAQTDIVIACVLVAGTLQLSRGQEAASGALLGLGAAFKGTPGIWLPYLLLRRKFLACGTFIVTGVAVNLIPDLISRAPGDSLWVWHWFQRFVLPSQSGNRPVGAWTSDIINNQSLAGLLERWINLGAGLNGGADTDALLSPGDVRLILYGLLLVLAGVSILAAAASRRATARPREPEDDALEYGLVFILMLFASPMSSPAHFVVLAPPALALAHRAARTGDLVSFSALCLAGVLTLFGNKDLVGSPAYGAVLWAGGATWTAFILWAASLVALVSGRRGAPVPTA